MALHIGIGGNFLDYGGGTERAVLFIANTMVMRGHRVTLFCAESPGASLGFNVQQGVQYCPVSKSDAHENLAVVRQNLREAGLDAFVALSAGGQHLFWAVALLGTGVPYIYSERSCPELVEMEWSRAGRLACMSGADAIVLLFDAFRSSLPEFLSEKSVVIPNAAPEGGGEQPCVCGEKPGSFTLASLGRLAEVKQLHLLIEAFARLESRFPDWNMDIWGSGPEETALKHSLKRFGASRVHLRGVSRDACSVFRAADLFCIPSAYEGFPNAALEALACGAPVVGFAACPGVNSLIKDGVNGVLAPEMTAASLAAALERVMSDGAFRGALAKGALTTAGQYAPGEVAQRWEDLFYAVAAKKGHTVMDGFHDEPFASMARLSAAARREYLFRNFGDPYPGTWAYYQSKGLSSLSRWMNMALKVCGYFNR